MKAKNAKTRLVLRTVKAALAVDFVKSLHVFIALIANFSLLHECEYH